MHPLLRTARRSAEPSAMAAAATPPGTWKAAGNLPFAGFWAQPSDAAVVLNDNRVLLAGGEDGRRAPLANAALFDPGALTWSATGALGTPRRLHTMTKLADGRVLAVGGIAGPPSTPAAGVASAEIFDPAAGAWTPTGSMREARFAHSASLLPDGKVLVAGGNAVRSAQSNRALRTCEIFDPATGQWTPAAPLNDARFGHPAVVLGDHRVLVVGGVVAVGRGRYTALGYCEVYDPNAGTWTPTGSLATPRKSHQATLLADGTVLATGGDIVGLQDWHINPYSLWSSEVFTVGTGVWSAGADMPYGRSHHRAVKVGTKALIAGGTDDSSFDIGYQHADSYDPAAKTWTTVATVVGRWAPAAVVLNDGRVLLAGGITRSGAAAPVVGEAVVTPTTEIFTPAA
jgi:N-acetylneuraminic acid mutarotase